MIQLRKYRWSRDYESAEEELQALFVAKKISAISWELESFAPLEAKILESDSRLWCAEGSIAYLVDGKKFSLQPGDTLDIPAFMPQEAVAGIAGCTVYEASV